MKKKTINISEKSLGDLIKQSFDLLKADKPITFDNGELDKPIHMEPGPYEPNDKEHCPFCGKKLMDSTGFCNEQCENLFYSEDDLRAEDEKREQEKRDSI